MPVKRAESGAVAKTWEESMAQRPCLGLEVVVVVIVVVE
jgi:hypothetical protein